MQDRFARDVLDRFRATQGVVESWYAPERFAIGYRRAAGDTPGWAHLGNLFAECAEVGDAERDTRIAWYVDAVVDPAEIPADWAAARPLLRPVLAGVTFGRQPDGGSALLRRPALPQLDELVVVDLPTKVGYVSAATAADWGVSAADVFAAARANLPPDPPAANGPATGPAGGPATRPGVPGQAAAGPGRPGSAGGEGDGGVLRFVDGGDAYWVPRLLLDGWLAGLAGAVGGRPVAFAPARDTLLVVADSPALPSLMEIVEAEYREAVRPVSPMAYTVDGQGRLVPYPAPVGDPMHRAVLRAERVLAGAEYDGQADALRDSATLAGLPGGPFVASYLMGDRDDGTPFSLCTWGEDLSTLLPATDRVCLVDASCRRSWLVDWADLAEVTGLTPVPGLVPERFQVDRWPAPPARTALFGKAEYREGGADG